jgi:hypothetical protein
MGIIHFEVSTHLLRSSPFRIYSIFLSKLFSFLSFILLASWMYFKGIFLALHSVAYIDYYVYCSVKSGYVLKWISCTVTPDVEYKYISQKRWYASTRLNDVIAQETTIWIFTILRTPIFMYKISWLQLLSFPAFEYFCDLTVLIKFYFCDFLFQNFIVNFYDIQTIWVERKSCLYA